MSIKPAKIQFNGGELSPWLAARTDIAKYDKTAKLCRNFIPLTEGSLKRRGGTCFVAKTPETSRWAILVINPSPKHADVFINNVKTNVLTVECGDTVFYEVHAKGYAAVSGKVTVVANTTLEIKLVSYLKRHTLTIVTAPNAAVVKINGVARKTYEASENEEVCYIAYENYCLPQTGKLILKEDKTLHLTLAADTQETYDYGDWGELLAFISCSFYGCAEALKKCFLIRFENGYLPILFDAKLKAPTDEDFKQSCFVFDNRQGFNALYQTSEGAEALAVIRLTDDGVFYDDLEGKALFGIDFKRLKNCGLAAENQDSFEAVFSHYDGYLTRGGVKVCYDGVIVWTLKGRNNG